MSAHPRTATTRRRTTAALALTATAAALTLIPGSVASAATAPLHTAYSGDGYGSTVALGIVHSGTTALTTMCTTSAPTTHTIHTARVTLPGVGEIGAVDTTLSASKVGGATASTSTSATAQTSLLAGVVQAQAIKAVARVQHTTAGYTLAATTSILNLTIAGKPVPANPKPNTKMTLPGLGSLILNSQARTTRFGNHAISVAALTITINANALGIPAGRIVIGHAQAALHDIVHSNVTGNAYGTTISAAGVANSGRTAPIYLPCGGSSGKLLVNSTATVAVRNVLNVGAVRSYGRSTDSAKSTVGTTTNQLANVTLFGGTIRVKAITAHVVVTRTARSLTRSAAGSSFGGITIRGKAYTGSTAPNTKYAIPGLGTLYLNRQIKTSVGLQVIGLQLVLGTPTSGLPAGATITIASATAAVAPR